LQPANLNRLGFALVVDARAFAEGIDRADARAAQAEDVGIENFLRAPAQVAGGDLLDKRRDVDVRRARARARRVETEQTPVGFHFGVVGQERRLMSAKFFSYSALDNFGARFLIISFSVGRNPSCCQ